MKIRDRDLNTNEIQEKHLKAGLPQLETITIQGEKHPFLFWFSCLAVLIIIFLLVFFINNFIDINGNESLSKVLAIIKVEEFWIAVIIGFFAQVIDGALGMAYGISATTFLLSTGASPAVASASVHIAAVFTTGLSGIAHVNLGNVSKDLFLRLLIPGIFGAILGVLVVTQVETWIFKPIMCFYLLIMGLIIIRKAMIKRVTTKIKKNKISKLALVGGFMDSAGGGGWGPIVTTNLIGSGQDPRSTIGSVNFAEFFLTLSTAGFFTIFITSNPWVSVAGLILGGLFAAPFAAYLCKYIPPKVLMVTVGFVVSGLSVFTIYQII